MDFFSLDLGAFLLFVMLMLGHGLMLFNDGLYWDGWIVWGWQKTSDWDGMRRFFREVGMPLLYVNHRSIARFPCHLRLYKLLGFLSLYIVALSIYLIGAQFIGLPPAVAFALASLVLLYPGQQMLVEPVVSMNYLSAAAVFSAAAWLSFFAIGIHGIPGIVLRIFSLLLFFFSFNMNSLLIFYGAFFLLFALVQAAPLPFPSTKAFLLPLSLIDYALVPPLYWFLKEKLTPRCGVYASYNRISPNYARLPADLRRCASVGLEQVCRDAVIYPFRRKRWAVLAATVIGLLLARFLIPATPLAAGGLLIFGFFTFVLAVLPYILVGQPISRRGWGTKNNLLLGIPFASFTVGVSSLLLSPPAFSAFMLVVMLLGAVYLSYIHLHWLAVWAKNLSILHHLANIPGARDCAVIGLCDRHPIRGAFDDGHPEHASVFFTYMLLWAFGELKCLGMVEGYERTKPYAQSEIDLAIANSTIDYSFQGLRRDGPQGVAVADVGPLCGSDVQVGWNYLLSRYVFRNRHDEFLTGLTRLSFRWIQQPPAAVAIAEFAMEAKKLIDNQQWDAAAALLKQALEKGDENFDALISLGICHLNLGEPEQGESCFRRAHVVSGSDDALFLISVSQTMAGKLSDAECTLGMILATAPNNLEAIRCLAENYIMQTRENEAIGLLKKVAAAEPENLDNLSLLAGCYKALGQQAQALETYANILRLDPDQPAARKELGCDG